MGKAAQIVEVKEITEEDTAYTTGRDWEAKVIVYNCDCHTYQQVIDLFCRIILGMNPTKAFELAWRIDHQGSAEVFIGERKIADSIARQLAAGGLKVEVQ